MGGCEVSDENAKTEGTWLGVKRSDSPTLKSHVFGSNPVVLTERMMIDGLESFRKLVEARRQKAREMAPWNLMMGKVANWLFGARRYEEAERLIVVVSAINTWGATNQDSLEFLQAVVKGWSEATGGEVIS
jgi:hypothetical protein